MGDSSVEIGDFPVVFEFYGFIDFFNPRLKISVPNIVDSVVQIVFIIVFFHFVVLFFKF